MPPATDDVKSQLEALRAQVEACTRCELHATRTRAVFGEGDPQAALMFVGEAPGYHEDQQGRPFVGAAGKTLEELLASIGLSREQVFIANVLKSRPPNNRDPRPEEISACEPWLWQQIALIRPSVICTLGNFATKLLSGDPTGITRVHGRPQLQVLGDQPVHLYPIFHPAAALYTPSMMATLKEDFLRLPALLAAPPAGWRDGEIVKSGETVTPSEPAAASSEPAPTAASEPAFVAAAVAASTPPHSEPAAAAPAAQAPPSSGQAPPPGQQLGLF